MPSLRPATAASIVTIGLAASAGLQTNFFHKAEMASLLGQMQASTPSRATAGESAASPAFAAARATPAGASEVATSSATSLATQGGRVQILSQGPLCFSWRDGAFRTFIHLWNPGQGTEKVTFSMAMHDITGEPRVIALATPAGAIHVAPGGLVSVPMRLAGLDESGDCKHPAGENGPLGITIPARSPCYPLGGILVVRDEQTAAAPKKPVAHPEVTPIAVVLPPPPAAAEMQSQIVFRSSVVALCSVIAAGIWAWIKQRPPWDPVEGSPDWDFSKSWSANVTLFFGLLNALLTFGGLPAETVILPKTSYMILSIIAIAMIGIGPLIFASIQIGGRGVVGALLAAGLVVLWAAYIQFGLVWLILAELVRAQVITAATNQILDYGLIAMALAMLVYATLGLKQKAMDSAPEAAPPVHNVEAPAKDRVLPLEAEREIPSARVQRKWNLL